MHRKNSFRAPLLGLVLSSIAAAIGALASANQARAESYILVDANSGKVLRADNATYPWHPASTTKLMTLYLTLAALHDARITPDTLFTVSANAAMQSPTKMGYPPGTQVTVDNAIKMMMVKSANDMAVLLAEGIGGSVEQFAVEMTDTAHRLGMSETTYVNPNGLPDDNQVTSARDLAILARALIHDFPEYSDYWHIPAIKYGRRIVRNYNPLIGRYPGADGMKTGFICASGFNLVATAEREKKRFIAVVLGAPSSGERAVKAAELLQLGFNQGALSWLSPGLGNIDAMTPVDAAPPDLTDQMCGKHRRRAATEEDDPDADLGNVSNSPGDGAETGPKFSAILSALRAPNANNLLLDPGPVTPVVVYTGPTRTPDQIAKLEAQIAAEAVKKKARHKAAAAKADAKADEHKPAKPDGKPENHKATKPVHRATAPQEQKPADVDGKRADAAKPKAPATRKSSAATVAQ